MWFLLHGVVAPIQRLLALYKTMMEVIFAVAAAMVDSVGGVVEVVGGHQVAASDDAEDLIVLVYDTQMP